VDWLVHLLWFLVTSSSASDPQLVTLLVYRVVVAHVACTLTLQIFFLDS
jgi:hypothetical protein